MVLQISRFVQWSYCQRVSTESQASVYSHWGLLAPHVGILTNVKMQKRGINFSSALRGKKKRLKQQQDSRVNSDKW